MPDGVPAVKLDLDGDGLPEQVAVVDSDAGWQVAVQAAAAAAAAGQAADQAMADPVWLALSDINQLDRVDVLGAVDLDGDGVNELGIRTGGGAYTDQLMFLRFRECELSALTFDDGEPAAFLVGASFGGGEYLVCDGEGTLERFSVWLMPGASSDDDHVYEGEYQPYVLEGDRVRPLEGNGATLTDEQVVDLTILDCLGLNL